MGTLLICFLVGAFFGLFGGFIGGYVKAFPQPARDAPKGKQIAWGIGLVISILIPLLLLFAIFGPILFS